MLLQHSSHPSSKHSSCSHSHCSRRQPSVSHARRVRKSGRANAAPPTSAAEVSKGSALWTRKPAQFIPHTLSPTPTGGVVGAAAVSVRGVARQARWLHQPGQGVHAAGTRRGGGQAAGLSAISHSQVGTCTDTLSHWLAWLASWLFARSCVTSTSSHQQVSQKQLHCIACVPLCPSQCRTSATASTWSLQRLAGLAAEVVDHLTALEQHTYHHQQQQQTPPAADSSTPPAAAGSVGSAATISNSSSSSSSAAFDVRQQAQRFPMQVLSAVNAVLFQRHGYSACNRFVCL